MTNVWSRDDQRQVMTRPSMGHAMTKRWSSHDQQTVRKLVVMLTYVKDVSDQNRRPSHNDRTQDFGIAYWGFPHKVNLSMLGYPNVNDTDRKVIKFAYIAYIKGQQTVSQCLSICRQACRQCRMKVQTY